MLQPLCAGSVFRRTISAIRHLFIADTKAGPMWVYIKEVQLFLKCCG